MTNTFFGKSSRLTQKINSRYAYSRINVVIHCMMNQSYFRIASTCAILLLAADTFAQQIDEVYALKIASAGKVPISAIAVGATTKDSIQICYMFWALKRADGKTIL